MAASGGSWKGGTFSKAAAGRYAAIGVTLTDEQRALNRIARVPSYRRTPEQQAQLDRAGVGQGYDFSTMPTSALVWLRRLTGSPVIPGRR